MKTLSTLKTLPLVGLLTIGLALVPAVSMADKNNHGHGKDKTYQSYDGGKSHHGVHNKSHYVHRHHKHGGHKHVYGHGRNHHARHVYRPGHKHHGHSHTDVVVVHDHHDDYDPFRLMLGLHFDNIDIIYRDF